jgi:hypothetical protein
MGKYRVIIEINMKKLAIVGMMVFSAWLSCKTGMGDALLIIIPCGLACLVSKEV